ncbi:hypothetical protein [Neisseria cinerea]|nr:hypothetical protein [Neisseria cinerea]
MVRLKLPYPVSANRYWLTGAAVTGLVSGLVVIALEDVWRRRSVR